MNRIPAKTLLEGAGCGALLRLADDISFWGGVDPLTGRIIDSRHPQYGQSVAGRILLMNRSIGSSSGSSVLLELFRRKLAPAGIILTEPDFIIVLGVVVAREMGFGDIPVIQINPADFDRVPDYPEIGPSGDLAGGDTRDP